MESHLVCGRPGYLFVTLCYLYVTLGYLCVTYEEMKELIINP
jgi:hypothetical protein